MLTPVQREVLLNKKVISTKYKSKMRFEIKKSLEKCNEDLKIVINSTLLDDSRALIYLQKIKELCTEFEIKDGKIVNNKNKKD